jgi:CMP-N-acetylneuraminic acid synthetase
MKSIEDICFIVQGRLGSQRVPQKMIRPFAGTTITDICLEKIKRSKVIPKENFYFSAFEPELKSIVKNHDLQCFDRSEKSAYGENSMQLIYEWHDKLPYKYVVLISACTPFLNVETIDSFVNHYINSEHDGLFGVIEYKDYFWNSQGAMVTPWPDGLTVMNTKVVEETYKGAHCLYASNMKAMKDDIWMGTFAEKNNPELFTLNEEECFDIDYEWQFNVAEKLYELRK